jgi:ActR/RegA family two-component response regulator
MNMQQISLFGSGSISFVENVPTMTSSLSSLPLEFLLVSTNYTNLEVVKAGSQQCGVNLDYASTVQSARDHMMRRKVDGVILDLDIGAALELMTSIRQVASNRRAFIFACVGGQLESAAALKAGANALLQKPLDAQTVASNIKSFQVIITCERRRSFRYPATVSVSLMVGGIKHNATTINLSEGGLAVRLPKVLPRSAPVDFLFQLPSGAYISGRGKIAWSNQEGVAGVEFQELREKSRENLVAWLVKLVSKPGERS